MSGEPLNRAQKRAALRIRAANALERAGLLKPTYALRRRVRSALHRSETAETDGGVPIPPERLRFQTCNDADLGAFLEGGERTAKRIQEIVESVGASVESFDGVLEFGCGSGRIARFWPTEMSATDISGPHVEWVDAHLPNVTARKNEADPPFPFEDDSFDFAYSISVLTHLPIPSARAWVADLKRVLKPGGLLLISLHGRSFADQHLDEAHRARFDAGEPIVLHESLAGLNGCFAFHPPAYAKDDLFADFEHLAHYEQDEVPEIGQDVHVVRLRP